MCCNNPESKSSGPNLNLPVEEKSAIKRWPSSVTKLTVTHPSERRFAALINSSWAWFGILEYWRVLLVSNVRCKNLKKKLCSYAHPITKLKKNVNDFLQQTATIKSNSGLGTVKIFIS